MIIIYIVLLTYLNYIDQLLLYERKITDIHYIFKIYSTNI